jgi:SAM-dependent methyltransferase
MDYRTSHILPEKGKTYSRSFEDLPYRKMIWKWEQKILLDILSNYYPNGTKVKYLDFACGTGRILGFLEDRVEEAVGVDVSESMLNVAREQVKSLELFLTDITRESVFPNNNFHLITAFRFFLNAQWDLKKEVMEKLSNLLSDDGYLVFNVHMNSGCTQDLLLRSYCHLRRRPINYNTLGKSDVIELLGFAKLKIVKVFHFGVVPVLGEKVNLPYSLLQMVETQFSKFSYLERLSQYSIYLCNRE